MKYTWVNVDTVRPNRAIFKGLGSNFSDKNSPNFGRLWGYFEKNHFYVATCNGYLFVNFNKNCANLMLTSGHTEEIVALICNFPKLSFLNLIPL